MSRLKRFLFGHTVSNARTRPAIKNQVYTVLRIWRNYSHHDYGLERALRLFLASSQFLSIGLYLKQLGGIRGTTARKMIIEFYVLFKVAFPLLALAGGYYTNKIILWLTVYFLVETMIYVTSLIFISDASRETVQPRRSLLLLFFNFFEIVFDYAVIYSYLAASDAHFFSRPMLGGTDAVYFSFVTAATVGYGDVVPNAVLAKQVAITQIMLTFVFVGLFLNYFSNLLQRTFVVETVVNYRKMRHQRRKK